MNEHSHSLDGRKAAFFLHPFLSVSEEAGLAIFDKFGAHQGLKTLIRWAIIIIGTSE